MKAETQRQKLHMNSCVKVRLIVILIDEVELSADLLNASLLIRNVLKRRKFTFYWLIKVNMKALLNNLKNELKEIEWKLKQKHLELWKWNRWKWINSFIRFIFICFTIFTNFTWNWINGNEESGNWNKTVRNESETIETNENRLKALN